MIDLSFGKSDPRHMPTHFFLGCVHLDYASAIKADIAKQNYSVGPRQWYVDATIRCERCESDFVFSANEQRAWYEEYGFFVDSFPKKCLPCRRDGRDIKSLRQEYDRDVALALLSNDCTMKKRVVTVVDQLCEANEELPTKVMENRKVLVTQIARQTDKTPIE